MLWDVRDQILSLDANLSRGHQVIRWSHGESVRKQIHIHFMMDGGASQADTAALPLLDWDFCLCFLLANCMRYDHEPI